MIAVLKLIRFPNLLIIAFTLYVVRYCLMMPVLGLSGIEVQMPEWEFALMTLATLFIAAAGYIINDYFDVRIDAINKPEDLVIDKGVKRRVAMAAHAVLSAVGVLIGLFISWRSGILLTGGVLFTLSVIGLWFYSTTFKYKLLTGNLLVAFLTSTIPFMPILFEVPRLILENQRDLLIQVHRYGFAVTETLLLWGGAYAAFAFLLSVIREMIKDMEDIPGDQAYGCRTAPIAWGLPKAKLLVYAFILITMAGTGFCQKYLLDQLHQMLPVYYFAVTVQFPLLVILYVTWKAKEKKHFYTASVLTKLVMLCGIGFLIVLRYFLIPQ